MAQVSSQRSFLSPCGGRRPFSCSLARRKSPGFVMLRRVSSLRIDTLRLVSRSGGFHVRRLHVGSPRRKTSRGFLSAIFVQMTLSFGKSQKWWEKGLQPNMKEIESAHDLANSLLNAGDKLVIVDFFSPGCGGCRALYPKICQIAEMNPNVQFLQINYEKHKSMCYTLNVHVLPFFRFYRGAQGRLCSFSCTNATIKKFKDALAMHSTDRCSLGPAKGLDESELLSLAANKDLSFSFTKNPVPVPNPDENSTNPNIIVPTVNGGMEDSEEETRLATAER
ncbi:thioredoxin-like 1-2, chloroplastic [Zingiber officinale]|uniref:thioredoxin-like 1-2, chloroplastic n=1 Tax=Zingiber officinale TaxID=94328 RepID=UPI001C4D77DB|nr:thioredoxin-like 1-2, chloroplastic [Zingiber officinale]